MRHRTRHIHRTMFKLVESVLDTNGWLDDPVTLFPGVLQGPVTLLDYEPLYAGETPEFNTVAVSLGDEGADEDFELGGNGKVFRIPLFVDIYPVNEPIGIAIADDVKVGLVDLVVPITNYATQPTTTVGLIEVDDVQVEQLQSAVLDKRSWRAVKAVLEVYPQ